MGEVQIKRALPVCSKQMCNEIWAWAFLILLDIYEMDEKAEVVRGSPDFC